MPIYEFKCSDCQKEFDELCSMGCNSVPCPKCGSANTRKKVSTFAAMSSGSEGVKSIGGGHSCGSCHSGSCSTCH
jgi:putative FmdB family regulatory protein